MHAVKHRVSCLVREHPNRFCEHDDAPRHCNNALRQAAKKNPTS